MKLNAKIVESVPVKEGNNPQSIIVQFIGDKKNQNFEVLFFDLDPFRLKMRKWDIWELSIKWRSDIFKDKKTGGYSYQTTLVCDNCDPILEICK